MRPFAFAAAIVLLGIPSVASAADLGVSVNDFAQKMRGFMQQDGSDVTLSQPVCTLSGVQNCTMNYGGVQILVDAVDNGKTTAKTVTYDMEVVNPIYQIFEALEYGIQVVHPGVTPIMARRTALRADENLYVSRGKPFTDVVDGYKIATSSHDGKVYVTVSADDAS